MLTERATYSHTLTFPVCTVTYNNLNHAKRSGINKDLFDLSTLNKQAFSHFPLEYECLCEYVTLVIYSVMICDDLVLYTLEQTSQGNKLEEFT